MALLAAVAVSLVAPAAGVLVSGSAVAASGGAGTTATSTTSGVPVDRVIRDNAIEESSGLAGSIQHPNVLWTINDSGNPSVLYAVARNGDTAAEMTVKNVRNRDWEAVATLRDTAGTPLVAVADIGDNAAARDTVDIVLLREPSNLEDATLRPVLTLRLTYPDGARDAETMLADPRTGRLHLVSKNAKGGALYTVPTSAWPGKVAAGASTEKSPEVRAARLTRVATVDVATATDGAMMADGRIALRSYNKLAVLPAPSSWGDRDVAPVLGSATLPKQPQGESLTVVGNRLLVGSEGVDQPVLRVGFPAGVTPPATTSKPAGTPDVAAAQVAPTTTSSSRHRHHRHHRWARRAAPSPTAVETGSRLTVADAAPGRTTPPAHRGVDGKDLAPVSFGVAPGGTSWWVMAAGAVLGALLVGWTLLLLLRRRTTLSVAAGRH